MLKFCNSWGYSLILLCRMLKHRYSKILVSSFLVLMALWVATPKVYIHDLLHHSHSEISTGDETKVKSQSVDDCDFEKYNKPAYFSIFKFIFSFIPLKSEGKDEVSHKDSPLHLFRLPYPHLSKQPSCIRVIRASFLYYPFNYARTRE